MSDLEGGRRQRDLDALRVELGLAPPPATARTEAITSITLDVGGQDLVVWVPTSGKHAVRQQFKDLARREKRWAADSANGANTLQLVGGSIGGALTAGGVIALSTASTPLAIVAMIVTGLGALTAAVGLIAGHQMNKKKFEHEELMERYSEIAEELS